MLGPQIGTLHVDVNQNVGGWTSAWSVSGSQGDQWNAGQLDLYAAGYTSGSLQVRFRDVTIGASYQGDTSIDNIVVTGTLSGFPSDPTSLDATGNVVNISLTWNTPASDGGFPITGYKIYRGASPNPTTLIDTTGVTNSYIDTGIISEVVYYRVRATNATGDGIYSNDTTFDPYSTIFFTSGTSWTVPADWNDSDNTIEVIGGGGGGRGRAGDWSTPLGGGGGAYSKITNLVLTLGGSVTYQVGLGGPGGPTGSNGSPGQDTWFNASTCATSSVCAKGGAGGRNKGGGQGGSATSGIGTTKYSGGSSNGSGNGHGWGGGGAAGLNGDGGDGVPSSSGGTGDNGFGGVGGGGSQDGSPGMEWDTTHGSGGGGGGGSTSNGVDGGQGGLYGGAGGGADDINGGSGGDGAQGLIIITYYSFIPSEPTAPLSLTASGDLDQISLSWTTPSDDGGSPITAYKIYRDTSPSATTLIDTLGVVTSYIDTTVTPEVTYYYRIKATNVLGDSAYSNEDNAAAIDSCPNAGSGGNITGWAWSDTIGWVSLNSGDTDACSTEVYGLNTSGGLITGYAWSENIGWIQFGGLSGFPSGPGTTNSNATVIGSTVVGWVRAISYSDPQAGGWDGWISLSGTGYGLTKIGESLTGYAWGDMNIGWLDFSANYPCGATEGFFCDAGTSTYRDLQCVETTIEACSYLCTAGACVPPPDPRGNLDINNTAITISPGLVRPNGIATVVWGTDDTISCTVTGSNGDSWTGLSGVEITSPITTLTTYTLDCDGSAGTTLTQTARVLVAPLWREF